MCDKEEWAFGILEQNGTECKLAVFKDLLYHYIKQS